MATLAEDPVETYFVKFECSIGANALVNHWAPFDSDMLNYLSQDNYREGLTLTTLEIWKPVKITKTVIPYLTKEG